MVTDNCAYRLRRSFARLLFRLGFPTQARYVLPRWTQAEVDDINRRAQELARSLAPYIDDGPAASGDSSKEI